MRLIEREELDITKVSLAVVADQYLAHIAVLQEISAANLADFLVVAAKLLVIKSRRLLPGADDGHDEGGADDLADELAHQLLEYKRFKEVAKQLRSLEETGLRAYPRIAPPPSVEKRIRPGEVTLAELLAVFKRTLEAHPPAPPVDEVVSPLTIRVEDCVQLIRKLVRRYPRVRFSTLMRRARSWLEVIVIFLAVLEMIKQQNLRATQDQLFGEIYLAKRQPDPGAAILSTDPGELDEAR